VSWIALVVLAAGTYAFKAIGPLVVGAARPSARLQVLLALLPAALLAGLIATQTFADGQALTLDARAAGVAAAGVAVWRGAPFVVVVLIGTATAAILRLLGAP
jgi:hypothetical protein